jgi:thioredoxin 1
MWFACRFWKKIEENSENAVSTGSKHPKLIAMVKTIGSLGEFNTAIAANNLTVVDFFAEWCGPCKRIAPFIEGLVEKYPSVTFVKVDVDQCQEVAQAQQISAMPTFKFFVNGEMVDEMRGADPNGLEAKVTEHMNKGGGSGGSIGAFGGAGHTLAGSTGASAGAPPVNARDARLLRFGAMAPGTGDGRQMIDAPMKKVESKGDDTDADLAKAIALSISEGGDAKKGAPTPAPAVPAAAGDKKNTVFSAAENDAADAKEAQQMFDDAEEKDYVDGEELVPLPVDEGILAELLAMGFSDTRARKGIHYGKNLDGAVTWISENENDPTIDEAFMVKKSDTIPKVPLTAEEKAQKMQALKEVAAKRRKEREDAEAKLAISREKERRERGQNVAETQETREKMARERERLKIKREKAEAAAEKKRLLEEIKRDKAIRAANKGVLPSVLGVDGYNPSAVQFDQSSAPLPDGTPAPAAAAAAAPTAAAAPAAKATTGAIVPGAAIANPEQTIDGAIATISKYRTSGDGGNALKLLVTFVGNVHKNPAEAKYRSINTEGNAFKTKLGRLVGPVTMLRALGFEKTDDGKLKLEGDATLSLVASTFNKLTAAEEAYWKANP